MKLASDVAIVSTGALTTEVETPPSGGISKGMEVHGVVDRFNSEYGVTFTILGGGGAIALAKKSNLSHFS